MVTAKITALHEDMPNHPDLSALIKIISFADPLVVAEGSNDGEKYVIITDSKQGASFTFTKTGDGYSLTRTK